MDAQANFKNAYFDSLSVIPDANLPRIQIIDRTMVGLGLISPDELAGIHDVGQQMSEIRGDMHAVAATAERAVLASREERAAIKAQKKEEAARKKQAHAEAVARRRATDIVYLGRGVSAGLADRRSNVEKLAAQNLPVLSTPADLAAALGTAIPASALPRLPQRRPRPHALRPLHRPQKVRRHANLVGSPTPA